MQRYTSNQRKLLDILRCHQPITRAAVTDLTDLTQQSVHRILEGLIADGLVVTERGRPSGRGKPSPTLQLNDATKYSLGISLDVDACRLSIVNFSGALIDNQTIPIATVNDGSWVHSLKTACQSALANQGISSCQLCGIGIAVSRALDVTDPANPWFNLLSILGDAFSVPTFVEKKPVAAAIGESLTGVGRQYRNFAFVSLDREVSGAFIHDGMAFGGHFGNAGNYSWVFENSAEPQRMSLHALLEDLQKVGAVVDLAELQSRLDLTLPGVADWLKQASTSLAKLVRTIAGILDPQAIVFGGQLPKALGSMLIEEVTRYQLLPAPESQVPAILVSAMAGDGAATGSALLPLKYLYFR